MFEYPRKTTIIRTVFKLLTDILYAPTAAKLNELGYGIEGFEHLRKHVAALMQQAESLNENERATDYQKKLLDCEEQLILLMQAAFRHRKLELNESIDLDFHKNNIEYLRNLRLDEETHKYPLIRALYHYIVLSAEIFNLRLLPRNAYDHNARNFIIKSLSILRVIFNFRTEFKTLSYQATDNISAEFFNEVAEGGGHLFHVEDDDRLSNIKGYIAKLLTVFNEQLDFFGAALQRYEKSYYIPEGSEASRAELLTIGRIRQQREAVKYIKNLAIMTPSFIPTMRQEVDSLLEKMVRIERLSSTLTLLTEGKQSTPDNLRTILRYELENIYFKAHTLLMEARFFVETEESVRVKADVRLVIFIAVGLLGLYEDEKLDGPLYTSIKQSSDYRLMIESMTPYFLSEYFSRDYSPAVYSLIGVLCISMAKNTLIPAYVDGKFDYLLNAQNISNLLSIMTDDGIRPTIVNVTTAEHFIRNLYCASLTLCKLDYERNLLAVAGVEAGILHPGSYSPDGTQLNSTVMKGSLSIYHFIHNLVMHMNAEDGVDMNVYFTGLKANLTASIAECRMSLADCSLLDEAHVGVRLFILRYAPLVMKYAANVNDGEQAYEAPIIQALMQRYYQHMFDKAAVLLPDYLPEPKSVIKPRVDKSSFIAGSNIVTPVNKSKLKPNTNKAKPNKNKAKVVLLADEKSPSQLSSSSKTLGSQPPTIDSDFNYVFEYYKRDPRKTIDFFQKFSTDRYNVTTRAKSLLGYAEALTHVSNNAVKLNDAKFQADKMFDKAGELYSYSPDNCRKLEAKFNELLAPFIAKAAPPASKPIAEKSPIKQVVAAAPIIVHPAVKQVSVKAKKVNSKAVTKNVVPAKKSTVASVGIFKNVSVSQRNATSHISAKPQPGKRKIKSVATMEKFSIVKTSVSKVIYKETKTNVSMETLKIETVLTPPTTKSKMKLSVARNISFTPFDPFEGSRVSHPSAIVYTLEQKNLVNVLHQLRMHPVIHGGAPYDKLCFRENERVSRSRDIDLHVCGSVDNLMMLCKANAVALNLNLALSRIDSNDVAVIVFNSKLPNGEYDSFEICCLPVSERDYKAALLNKSQEFLIDRLLVDAITLNYLNLNGEYDRVARDFLIHLTVSNERRADELLLHNPHRLLDIIKRNAKPNQRGIPMRLSYELAALVLRNWVKLQNQRNGKIKMKQFDSLFLQGFTQLILDVKCENRQLLSILFPSLEHVMDDDMLNEMRIFCAEFDRKVESNINEPRTYETIFAMRVEFLTKLLLPGFKRRYNDLGELLKENDRFIYACKRLLGECMFDLTNKYDVQNPFDARDTLVRRLIKTWRETLSNELAVQSEPLPPVKRM